MWFHSKRSTRQTPTAHWPRSWRTAFRPQLQLLEDRTQPSTLNWINPTGGDWNNAANWQEQGTGINRVPGAADDAVIDLGANDFTVTHSSGSHAVHSLVSQDAFNLVGGSLFLAAFSEFHNSLILANGGVLSGWGDIAVDGSFIWSGGTLAGPAGSTLTALGGITVGQNPGWSGGTLDGRTLVNPGMATFTAGLGLQNGAVFDNQAGATLDLRNDSGLGHHNLDGTTYSIINAGRITKSSGTGESHLAAVNNTSTGTIDIQQGSLFIGQIGVASAFDGIASQTTLYGAPGTTLAFGSRVGVTTFSTACSIQADRVGFGFYPFTGTYQVAGSYAASTSTNLDRAAVAFTGPVAGVGDLTIRDNYSSSDFSPAVGGPVLLTIASLNLQNDGMLTGTDSFRVIGPITWRGGTLAGPAGSTLTALGGMTVGQNPGWSGGTLDGRTLVNGGAAIWTNGDIRFFNGASFTNLAGAALDDQTDGTFGGSGSYCMQFTNAGMFVKSGGTGVTTLYAQLINSGTVRVESGQLNVHCGITQSSGSSGTISGAVISSINNAGEITVAPSLTPPPVVPGYTQSLSGILTEQIGGYAAGTQYGQIVVTDTVNLAGTLRVVLVNGFAPHLGDQFTIIDNRGANPVGGAFAGLSEWTVGGPLVYDGHIGVSVSYVGGDGNDVVLTVRVVSRPTATTLVASATTPLFGVDGVTLSATVAAPGGGTPTGSVTFYDGTTALGTANVIDGVATLSLGSTALAVGPHTLRAVYGGNGGFLDSDGTANLTVLAPSTVQGLAYVDFNNDGQVDFGERGIANAIVTLTGTDDLGHAVNRVVQTDADGVYAFTNLRPSSAAGYTVSELQPAGYLDGRDTLGTIHGAFVGSAAVNDVFSSVVLTGGGSLAENYNFGERPASTGTLGAGQTAGIGFWQNKNGQNLIKALNDGATATQLGHWLAITFPNMYAGLDGMTNAQVAAYYKTLFARSAQSAPGGPPKTDAQVMATALAVYVTNQTLAGTTAVAYGFQVTVTGVGTRTVNVGNRGAAFGVANGTSLSVMDLLLAVNARSRNGLLYDANGNGQIDSTEASYRTMANDVFSAINEAGGL